jgi:hypothetical protein
MGVLQSRFIFSQTLSDHNNTNILLMYYMTYGEGMHGNGTPVPNLSDNSATFKLQAHSRIRTGYPPEQNALPNRPSATHSRPSVSLLVPPHASSLASISYLSLYTKHIRRYQCNIQLYPNTVYTAYKLEMRNTNCVL